MIAFIDDHRQAYGVEPICRVLPIVPSTWYEHLARRRDPTRRPARVQRDEELRPEVLRVFTENFGVYGVRKVWRQKRRENHPVAVTDPGLFRSGREFAAFLGLVPRQNSSGARIGSAASPR